MCSATRRWSFMRRHADLFEEGVGAKEGRPCPACIVGYRNDGKKPVCGRCKREYCPDCDGLVRGDPTPRVHLCLCKR